MLAIAFIKMW